MSDKVPTIKIKNEKGDGVVTINMSDYDAAKHTLATGEEVGTPEPLAAGAAQELIGSSHQPATFTTATGEVKQLTDLVAEAHKRSGASDAEWNGMSQANRDDLIDEVVREVVPAAIVSGYSITNNGKRGAAAKFIIIDVTGKQVGTDEFDTVEAAKAKVELIEAEKAA